MKCKTMIFGLSLGLVAGLMWMPGSAADGQDFALMGGGESPFGFGKKIAGTYSSPAGFGGALTLNADGTVIAISGSCCGAGANANIQSPALGNWERTGVRQVTLRALIIGTQYDLAGQPMDNFAAAAAEVLDFAEDFQSYTGTLCTSLWFYPLEGPIPDVDVDPPDLIVGPFPLANTRLAVFQECPPPG
ncbi:MAG: hypothetical protein ACYTFF_07905 [Planctomycetota bacterium]|jgi:hypothetical protein